MEPYIVNTYNLTRSPRQETFSMHTHNTHEIYCFLSGDADYSVEGHRYALQPGDVMLMRRGEAHHLVLRSAAPYQRMVINFDLPEPELLDPEGKLLAPLLDRPLGKFNHYRASQFPENQWQYYFHKMNGCATPHQKLCWLLPLLSELGECFKTVCSAAPPEDRDRAAAIIRHINRNLCAELSLEDLADRFYLSKTHLNRLFKQSTGSTVWHYITVKRLFLARELIVSGESPSRVCAQCGFHDYTTFFRAYKKQFGISPQKEKI